MKKTVSTLLMAVSVLVTPLFAAEIRYAYDERRQLTSVVRDGREAFGYGYDLAGNLLWASIGCKTNVYETNCLNQYTTVTDGDGNVHRLAYDEDGNLIEDAVLPRWRDAVFCGIWEGEFGRRGHGWVCGLAWRI